MNKKVLLITILMIVIITTGVTLAWYSWASASNTLVSLNINGAAVTYNASNITKKLVPTFSRTNEDNVIETITISATKDMYFTLGLGLTTLDSGLKHESFKYELYEGATQLKSGNFSTLNQGDVITLLDRSTINTTTRTLTLYIWIDGNQSNPATMQNQYFSFNLRVNVTDQPPNGISGANAPSIDTSGSNPPSIDTSYMVPVYYDSTSSNWKIANKNNNTEENTWYNYTGKQWANMVLVRASASSCTPGTDCLDSVTKHDRDYYTNQSNVGESVSMDDILAFYVWIPRYKYKVWNINKIPQNNQAYTYNAYNDGIDIQWESGTDTSGNVSCTYYYTAPVATAGSPNETCIVAGDTSNPYYTHPAFTFGDDELTGIWVGKFETSSNTHLTGDAYGGGNVTSLTARIVPNVTSWRYIEIGNMFTVLQNMHNASNEYGLPTTKTSVDSHMIKNTEWGAVAYLTNSIYGKCTGLPGGCTEVQINGKGETSYYTAITGCGPSADGATGSYNTACTEYNTTTGMLASTTGNITGVYDMSGGAWEYVMGNMSSATGAYTFNPVDTSSTMPVSWYTATTSKYVDAYAYGSKNSGQIAYNRSRLGDATGEVNITGSNTGGWYSDLAYFVCSSYSWFNRGGAFDYGTGAGTFFFFFYNGGAYGYNSFRASLVPLGAA